MGLTLSTNLKFYTSVPKGLKLKVRKSWELIPTFVEVTGEKLVGEPSPPPPSYIGLTKNSLWLLPFYMVVATFSFKKRCAEQCAMQLYQTSLIYYCWWFIGPNQRLKNELWCQFKWDQNHSLKILISLYFFIIIHRNYFVWYFI